jgi:sensor histidine kinase YesM
VNEFADEAASSTHRPRVSLLADLIGATGGAIVALLLLRYLHDTWQPVWALVCGLVAGVALRRLAQPGFDSFPRYLRLPLSLLTVLLGTVVASWATLARQPSSYWLLRWREAVTLSMIAAVLGLALVAVTYSHARMRREIEEARERAAALREEALRAQLRALQAQINPHFLFNAFNALAELTHDDPEVAEQLVGDLAHLLRYSLRSSAEGRVPLALELEATERYLRVEHARLGDRLRVTRNIDDTAADVLVPGLVLQPLVENAVQHAVASRRAGGTIDIEVRRESATVLIAVTDDGPGMPGGLPATGADHEPSAALGSSARGTAGAGGGLANVTRRLQLTYRGEATLTSREMTPGTRIEMRIPL